MSNVGRVTDLVLARLLFSERPGFQVTDVDIQPQIWTPKSSGISLILGPFVHQQITVAALRNEGVGYIICKITSNNY